MSLEKTLLCKDKVNGNIVCYKCKKRNINDFEINCFFSSLYGMKLNSSEVNSHALVEGKETYDLIKELRNILDDESSVIDLKNVIGLFDENVAPCVIETPIKGFLGMFTVNKEGEYTEIEWSEMVDERISSSVSPLTLQRQKEEVKSIEANTRALQNINLRNYQKRK